MVACGGLPGRLLSPPDSPFAAYAQGKDDTGLLQWYACPHSQCVVLGWLRLDNRSQLVARLGQQWMTASDPALLVAAYLQWQQDCVARLEGDFAFVLYDPRHHRLLLGRDATGSRPLYYLQEAGRVSVSMLPASLLALASTPPPLNEDWIIHYLMERSASHEATAYQHLHKLPPGHVAVVSPEGMQVQPYVQWDLASPRHDARDPYWVQAYREQLEQAVWRRVPAGRLLGCENSGGIDSASLIGFAARRTGGERIVSLGRATMAEEESHILATSALHGIRHNHLEYEPYQPTDRDIDQMLATLAYPVEHPVAWQQLPFYRYCQQHQVGTLFSGFGGDEVVTSYGARLPAELADLGMWRALWQITPGTPWLRALRLLKRGLERYHLPQASAAAHAQLTRHWQHTPLCAELKARPDLQSRFFHRDGYDIPRRSVNAHAIHNRLAMPYVATRMENSALLAASYGVEYCWPLLDAQLIRQFLRTPAIEKVGPGGLGRYLHRRAMEGIAPPMVQWRPSKDMGTNLYAAKRDKTAQHQTLTHRLEQVLACMSPQLAAIVDSQHLRRLHEEAGRHPHDDPSRLRQRTVDQMITRLQWLNRWQAGAA